MSFVLLNNQALLHLFPKWEIKAFFFFFCTHGSTAPYEQTLLVSGNGKSYLTQADAGHLGNGQLHVYGNEQETGS